jgi:hypothetical protein
LQSLAGIPLAEAAATAGALARALAVEASGSFPPVRAEASQLTMTIPARQRSPSRSRSRSRSRRASDTQAITGLLGIIVDNGNLDHAKPTAWGFVRTIDYWLWALVNGFTVDPARCQRIASALAPVAGHASQP